MPRPSSALPDGWRPALVLTVLFLVGAARADDDDPGWRLRQADETTGTRVYLRDRADGPPAFRAEARVAARLSALVAVLLDAEHMPQWVYRTRRVNPIDAVSPTQGVSQVIVAMPWPLDDREAIVAWQLAQDAQTGAVTIEGHSAPQRLPPDAALVRMPSFESRWRFAPRPDGAVDVRFEGHGDPGGNLALPLLRVFVDAAVWQAPLYTVDALRQVVTRPEYRDAVLPFVKEPPR